MKAALAVTVTVIALSAFALPGDAYGAEKRVYVSSHKSDLIRKILDQGGAVVRRMNHVTVLRCDEALVQAMNLEEDVRVEGVSLSSNNQVRATLVHQSGNTGQGRRIVVLDTGIDYLHPELASSYLGGRDFVNEDDDPMDDNGHGTFVAGLISADGVDASEEGIAPGAGIIAGKVLDGTATGFLSLVVEAIYWAVDGPDGVYGTADDFGADAISISIGTRAPYLYSKECDDVYPGMTEAISYAVGRNVPVVVAAGNSGRDGVSLPGCIGAAITVGAVDASDELAAFSGQGKSVDLVAPGVQLVSAWPGGNYMTLSGTSASTPLVSGTIALVKHDHPSYGASDVLTALTSTTAKLHPQKKYGAGREDAFAAVNYAVTATGKRPHDAAGLISGDAGYAIGNYPEPFNPSTTIRYRLPDALHVRLSVFTALGQRVAILVDEEQSTGDHSVEFNAADLPSGLYFYRLQAGNVSEVRKMLLTR